MPPSQSSTLFPPPPTKHCFIRSWERLPPFVCRMEKNPDYIGKFPNYLKPVQYPVYGRNRRSCRPAVIYSTGLYCLLDIDITHGRLTANQTSKVKLSSPGDGGCILGCDFFESVAKMSGGGSSPRSILHSKA